MEFSFEFFYNLFIYLCKASSGDKELAYIKVHLTQQPSKMFVHAIHFSHPSKCTQVQRNPHA